MTIPRILAAAGLALASLLAFGPAVAQQKDQPIVVTNAADVPIEFLYFAACGASDWGKDRLGKRELIEPGQKRQFKTSVTGGDCCHDFRAKMTSAATFQKLAVDVCREPEWVVK